MEGQKAFLQELRSVPNTLQTSQKNTVVAPTFADALTLQIPCP